MLDQPDKPATLAERVGLKMRELRKEKGMTLADVAARCETTPQTIQRLETGNMALSVDWLEAISKVLGVEPHVLFITGGAATIFEQAETRARKAEMAVQMLRAAVESVCRDQLGEGAS